MEQIKQLEDRVKNGQNIPTDDNLPHIPSPVKKTSFDSEYSNRPNNPSSSTYKLQTGIEVTQKTVNMTKK